MAIQTANPTYLNILNSQIHKEERIPSVTYKHTLPYMSYSIEIYVFLRFVLLKITLTHIQHNTFHLLP